MTNRIGTMVAFLLGAGFAFTTSAVAAGPGFGPFEGPPFLKILRDLQLTDEQQVVADDLIEAAKADREDGKALHEAHFETITTELGKARPNAGKLHAVVDEATARAAELGHARLDDMLALHATLTEAQRGVLVDGLVEAKELHQSHMEELRGRFGGGEGRPEPLR